MPRDGINPKIFDEVAGALDPDGKIREWRHASVALTEFLPWLSGVKDMARLAQQAERNLETAALANQRFSHLGWSVATIPVPVLEEALDRSETDIGSAEGILAQAWTPDRLDRGIFRMDVIYSRIEDSRKSDVRRGRCALMQEAKRLYEAENHAAVVPLLLANIEGFVADASEGQLFFTRRAALTANLLNPSRLTGLVCAMSTLREVYTTPVGTTVATAPLSRHGIMHGRVVGYDTKVTSAKCWSLFDAVADVLI